MSSYHVQQQETMNLRMLAALDELPEICSDFFLSIEQRTSISTRLGYAYDLRTFFNFVIQKKPEFGVSLPSELTIEHMKRLQKRDFELYARYLTSYVKEETDPETGNVKTHRISNHETAIKRKYAAIRALFKYLFSEGLIPANYAQLASLPKLHEHAIIRLDIDEVARMLDVAENGDALPDSYKRFHDATHKRDLALLSLFLGTGIRISECVGINIDDIDFEQNSFVVTRKGGKEAILYFSQEVADALSDYMKERKEIKAEPGHENAFFLSLQKKRISQRAVENMVKKYARVAAPLKKKISPHKLRSTFGTNLYRETGDIYLVADVLGHTDVNTTRKHYAAIAEDRRRIAAEKTVLRDDKR